jgi:hypothetical protein
VFTPVHVAAFFSFLTLVEGGAWRVGILRWDEKNAFSDVFSERCRLQLSFVVPLLVGREGKVTPRLPSNRCCGNDHMARYSRPNHVGCKKVAVWKGLRAIGQCGSCSTHRVSSRQLLESTGFPPAARGQLGYRCGLHVSLLVSRCGVVYPASWRMYTWH